MDGGDRGKKEDKLVLVRGSSLRSICIYVYLLHINHQLLQGTEPNLFRSQFLVVFTGYLPSWLVVNLEENSIYSKNVAKNTIRPWILSVEKHIRFSFSVILLLHENCNKDICMVVVAKSTSCSFSPTQPTHMHALHKIELLHACTQCWKDELKFSEFWVILRFFIEFWRAF